MAETMTVDDHTFRSCKPPNRRKFEEELEMVNAVIRSKEAQLKALNIRSEDRIQKEIDVLRNAKASGLQCRQSISNDLSKVNQDICKQEANLARLQSSLQYRSEARINEAVLRLQTQLSRRNFTLSEEKKIVSEIDSLKRSKKDLGVYLTAKKLLDEKREEARRMREERDKLYNEVTEMKHKEEKLRLELHSGREQAELLTHEIAELRKKVRTLQSEFSEQEKYYDEVRRNYIARQNKAKKDERKAAEHAYQHELDELRACSDPYMEQKLLCGTLLNYLQRFKCCEADTGCDQSTTLSTSQEMDRCLESEGMFVLRKKCNDEICLHAKTSKKSKKDRRRFAAKKHIVHTPEIFMQFERLGLSAPLSLNDVTEAVGQLTAIQMHYSSLPPTESCQVDDVRPMGLAVCISTDTSTTPSSAASFTGSIPSTPDTQHDMPLHLVPASQCLLRSTARRLSRDSGACELDDLSSMLADSVQEPAAEDSTLLHISPFDCVS